MRTTKTTQPDYVPMGLLHSKINYRFEQIQKANHSYRKTGFKVKVWYGSDIDLTCGFLLVNIKF